MRGTRSERDRRYAGERDRRYAGERDRRHAGEWDRRYAGEWDRRYAGWGEILEKKAKNKYSAIGGQALIEGIMMRSPEKTAFTVRKPDGNTVTEYIQSGSVKDKYKILRLPVLRGVAGFIESMLLGYKTLMRAADYSLEEPEAPTPEAPAPEAPTPEDPTPEAPTPEAPTPEIIETEAGGTGGEAPESSKIAAEPETEPGKASSDESPEADAPESPAATAKNAAEEDTGKKESYLMNILMVIAMIFGVGLAVVLFMWLPALLFDLVNRYIVTGIDRLRAVFESLIKILIFIIYLASVTLMSDIKRVFSYHGAEHKTIFCYEKKRPLTVENVRSQKRFHPRCGTSFLVLMMAVSIIINSAIILIFPGISAIRPLWVAIKILMIPLICGVGYEVLRLCGKYDNIFTKIVSAPGMWIQRLTTKEPDDGMIEVAITALKAVLPDEDPLNIPEDTDIPVPETQVQ